MKKRRWKDVVAVLVILVLLPYVFTLLVAGAGEGWGNKKSLGEQVTVAGDGYEETMELADYLTGALAAQIPVSYEPEALKAQAVLVTTCYEKHEKRQEIIGEKEDAQPYLSKRQQKELWGESYEENYRKLKQAVLDTQSACIYYEKELAEPYYHAVSAGMTRSGGDVFGDGNHAYLESADCPADITADNYVTMRTFSTEELCELFMQQGWMTSETSCTALEAVFENAKKDDAGYVMTFNIEGNIIHGEKLRTVLGLPSVCVEAEKWEDGLRIICRGRGHGLGMSLYTANELATEGKEYKEILKYFFKEITISPPADE